MSQPRQAVLWLAAGFAAVMLPAYAQTDQRQDIDGIVVHVSPRTPEQIAAFYEARGFARTTVEALSATCFLTVSIQNHRHDIVWLEPARWRIHDAAGREHRRLSRQQWDARFRKLNVPAANRATFGWTQLPETRDLRPAEPVGGNITLVPVAGKFTLAMRFATGADRKGPELVARFDNLTCPGH